MHKIDWAWLGAHVPCEWCKYALAQAGKAGSALRGGSLRLAVLAQPKGIACVTLALVQAPGQNENDSVAYATEP